jgi:hypothetical protein
MRVRRFWLVGQIVGALLLCGLGGGCGGTDRPKAPLPKLQPVRGQLLRAGQPVSGGSLRLEPIAAQSPAPGGQNLSIAGTVGPDGRFELVTLQTLSMQSGPGAPVGQYRATYYPPPSERPEDQAALQPITLPEPVTIQEGPNELKLSLDRPPAVKRK